MVGTSPAATAEPGPADAFGHGGGAGLVAVDHDDVLRSFGVEALHQALADPARAAGDHCDPSVEFHGAGSYTTAVGGGS